MFRRCLRRLSAAERLVEEYDAVIIGGGPAGLSCAIRLKQLAGDKKDELRVAVVEKGSRIGAHTLSGACIEPRALNELIPDWKSKGCPLKSEVTSDEFHLLSKTGNFKSPLLPPTLKNFGNYAGSLGALCEWLGQQAESLGVEIFPGYAAAEPVFSEDGNSLVGVQLNDLGINKKGEQSDRYEPGMVFKAKQTVLAEGCRGSITMKMEEKFKLRSAKNFPTYGLGIKEVWEVPKELHQPGMILHTAGWPLTKGEGHDNTYGGAFLYHYGENLMSCGIVVGLDYTNPYTRPYMEMQKWKTHPFIAPRFKGAKPIWYGARTLSEGGYASLPKMTFPGGVLAGDCAGTMNLAKIKGTHTAMKTGMVAAEALHESLFSNKDAAGYGVEVKKYADHFKKSWVHDELYLVRNSRQAFHKHFLFGIAYTGTTCMITKGMEPWTWPHHAPDHLCTKPASECKPIEYPKPDNVLTFDLLTNHSRSGTSHNADQPAHLKLKDSTVPEKINLAKFGGPEAYYCPAKVYEFVERDGKQQLVINAQNCLHCKACSIKDPTQNINWCVPEGGGGPNYDAQM